MYLWLAFCFDPVHFISGTRSQTQGLGQAQQELSHQAPAPASSFQLLTLNLFKVDFLIEKAWVSHSQNPVCAFLADI